MFLPWNTFCWPLGLVFVMFAAGPARSQSPGPGVPSVTFQANELFQSVARLTAATGTPQGHGFVAMHNGYLFVWFSDDGDQLNIGGFAFLDISNLRSPQPVFSTHNNPAYGPGTSNDPSTLREAHAFTFTSDNYVCLSTYKGLQFWNVANVGPPANSPIKVGEIIQLPGLSGGDYAPTPWWICWQGGRYVYVGGTSTGIHIVDATNPAFPVLVDRGPGRPNPIPVSQLGGFQIGPIFAIGNLLIITSHDNQTGMATLDISDPKSPVLLNVNTDSAGYSTMVNGNRILATGVPFRIYSISDAGIISFLANGPDEGFEGGYGTFQDEYFHLGASDRYFKIDVSTPGQYSSVGRFFAPDNGTDLDFGTSIGNLTFAGDDHGVASTYIVPHQEAPDTTGPAVNMVVPRSGVVNQALTSRVGLTFTDQVDLRTVNNTTLIVRPAGSGFALTGKYSHQTGIINFWPDAELQPNTTYEIVVPAGGIKDWAGNAITTAFTSLFSTGPALSTFNVTCQLAQTPTGLVGESVPFDVTSCGGNYTGTLSYAWNFGDGTPVTSLSPSAPAAHVYADPGRYNVTLIVTDGIAQAQFGMVQTIVHSPTPVRPTSSSPIILDTIRQRVWLVNPDSDTVTAVHAVNLTKSFEVPVGVRPQTLALAPDGTIWVTNKESATISILDGDDGHPLQTLALPRGSLPHGIVFSPTNSAAYVTLEGSRIVQKWDPALRTLVDSVNVGPAPRGIAVSHDGLRILITRFISPEDHGEVIEVGGSPLRVVRTFDLAVDTTPDSESNGRGVPNYLMSVTISPDGRRAWIPSKKDNTGRGLVRDGRPLTFESTVRTIASQLDLQNNTEFLVARKDFNDRALASAVAFSPLGEFAFVTTLASNTLEVVDSASSTTVTAIVDVGLAPLGLVLSDDGTRLFIHNFLSRNVAVYDVSKVGGSNQLPLLATIPAVTREKLASQVLQGKREFYNAADDHMSKDNYISCVVCHLDGDSDGRVWDFTDRGEGLRNTIALIGRGGMKHGPVHWSANFDEIQDFEQDIRKAFLGLGFMSDALYNTGTRNTPLGDPKAGVSPELDALAAYVSSLTQVHPSPYRNPDGTMTDAALRGEVIFRSAEAGCTICHASGRFTDSTLAQPYRLHDVGTIKSTSGKRLGQSLTGLDTPTLLGIWETGPYLHDGSAPTLADVITTANSNELHGHTSQLTSQQKQDLVTYVLELDNSCFNGSGSPDDADHASDLFKQATGAIDGPATVEEGSVADFQLTIQLPGAVGPCGPFFSQSTTWWIGDDVQHEVNGASRAAALAFGDSGPILIHVRVEAVFASQTDVLTIDRLIQVQNVAPTVDAGPDQTVTQEVGAPVPVKFTGTFVDPALADTHTYEWDFGDGLKSAGSITLGARTVSAVEHSYANDGLYTAKLTITDDDGGVGTDIVQVQVQVNSPPAPGGGNDGATDPGGTDNSNPNGSSDDATSSNDNTPSPDGTTSNDSSAQSTPSADVSQENASTPRATRPCGVWFGEMLATAVTLGVVSSRRRTTRRRAARCS